MTEFRNLLAGKRLPLLDGVRALSVLVVITAHFGVSVPSDLGVSAFFVLSGFLITWLLLRERDNTGETSLRGFYLRRTLRIFPAYYAFLLLAFCWDFYRGDRWPPALAFSGVSYTVNYFNAFNGHPSTSIAHAWSLAIEEQFYLLWPLGFIALAGRSRAIMASVLLATIVLSGLWRSYAFVALQAGSAYAYNAFECRIDGLAIGCLLAVLTRSERALGVLAAASRHAWSPLVTLALLYVSRYRLSDVWHYTAGFTVDAALLALVMMQLLHHARSGMWRWLDSAPMRFTGAISYPMYLWHAHALSVAHRLPLPAPVQLAAGVLVSMGLAYGSWRLLEQPFLRLRPMLERRLMGAPMERAVA